MTLQYLKKSGREEGREKEERVGGEIGNADKKRITMERERERKFTILSTHSYEQLQILQFISWRKQRKVRVPILIKVKLSLLNHAKNLDLNIFAMQIPLVHYFIFSCSLHFLTTQNPVIQRNKPTQTHSLKAVTRVFRAENNKPSKLEVCFPWATSKNRTSWKNINGLLYTKQRDTKRRPVIIKWHISSLWFTRNCGSGMG